MDGFTGRDFTGKNWINYYKYLYLGIVNLFFISFPFEFGTVQIEIQATSKYQRIQRIYKMNLKIILELPQTLVILLQRKTHRQLNQKGKG